MIFVDTRPAFISPEDSNDDIIPPAPKGRPKNGAEPSESDDESSGCSGRTSDHVSRSESSSDEDLTAMKRDMIQSKLTSEVKYFLSLAEHLQLLTF
jgi:hypothetical protein